MAHSEEKLCDSNLMGILQTKIFVGKLAHRLAEIVQKVNPLKLGEGGEERMAAQFESLTYPFIIMFSIPFAFSGVLMAL